MKIIAIRHGESLANVNGKMYELGTDAAITLTEKGVHQAAASANYLVEKYGKQIEADRVSAVRIATSPLFRAYQTAAIINDAINVNMHCESQLAELTTAVHPDDMSMFIDDKAFVPRHNSVVVSTPAIGKITIEARSWVASVSYLRRLLRNAEALDADTVVLVSHQIAMQAMLTAWTGQDYHGLDIGNGEIIGFLPDKTVTSLFKP